MHVSFTQLLAWETWYVISFYVLIIRAIRVGSRVGSLFVEYYIGI